MSELLKKFIEGYDETKIVERTIEDDWQEITRAYQNKLVMQATLEAIELHYDIPCAVVYIGSTKGIIPIQEYGLFNAGTVQTSDDLSDKTKVNRSYKILRSITGQKIAFIIKGMDKKNNLFTASRKEAIEWMKEKTVEALETKSITIGVVRNVNPFRVMLDIGGVTAVLKAEEYRHGWTDDLSEHVQVGDHIKIKVLEFDKENGHAVVSRKALIPDPWKQLDIAERNEYNAEITGIRETGAYFRIKSKAGYVEGFLKHPRHNILKRGDKALIRILNIDSDKKRIFGLYIRPINVS
jgi:predicted RNA-binding protein with RPS1 domain